LPERLTVPGALSSKVRLFKEVVLHWRLVDGGGSCEESQAENANESDLGAYIDL